MSEPYSTHRSFAIQADEEDPLRAFQDQFLYPEHQGKRSLYFCGNSLGLQPKTAAHAVEHELDKWGRLAVLGHFEGSEHPWFTYHRRGKTTLAQLAGARENEVVAMGNLTANLHLLLATFYRPTKTRFKILMEAGAFPSDQYVAETQVKWHGFDAREAIVEVTPHQENETLDTGDIIETIERTGEELALVLFSGIQYYTGQFFDLGAIAAAAHKAGANVGFDLAHAMGNVPLNLHDQGADFAVWCSYKYLNSGPGNVGGIYVHEQHGNNPKLFRLGGWWGHDEESRFQMEKGFIPMKGADGWQLSNVNVLATAAHLAALDQFREAGIQALRTKSLKLTGYLEFLLHHIDPEQQYFRIITPSDPSQRGCQLSLLMLQQGKQVFDRLQQEGVIMDWREPNVMRLAPTPMYNSFLEVYRLAEIIARTLQRPL